MKRRHIVKWIDASDRVIIERRFWTRRNAQRLFDATTDLANEVRIISLSGHDRDGQWKITYRYNEGEQSEVV